MRRRWSPLLALLILLVVASCGQEQPSLEPERSEVWRWPRDQSQQEVTTTTSAGDGDRVWTEEHGRALLKWADLWVRLYDDTQLQVEECGVTTDVCLAMSLGTALNGGVSGIDDRVSWTTDHAQIILTGTTVMVSYYPDTQLTIVRVFDGVVEVRNLMGDVQTASVSAGEWALVQPRQPPQVSDDLGEMRGLVLDLGLWDVFHEVEQDVEDGFGPADSQVEPENVDIVFVEVDLDGDGLSNPEEERLGTDPSDPDTDTDQLLDGQEVQEFRTNPLDADSDADGLSDGREVFGCTDPLERDTDGDQRGDGEEVTQGTDPCSPADSVPPEGDIDDDGLSNAEEERLGTDLNNPDTDRDELGDGLEVQEFGTNPLDADSDADGLSDGREAYSCTHPLDRNTDGDQRSDGEEVAQGTDPCDPADNLPPDGDADGDSLTNAQEWKLGTDPQNPDTDGDKLWDGSEIRQFGTEPLKVDSDDDGLPDGREAGTCTYPLERDSDGDGASDGEEVEHGTDPCKSDAPVQSRPDLIVDILSIDNSEIVWQEEPWSWIHYRVCNLGGQPAEPVTLAPSTTGLPTSLSISLQEPLGPGSCTEKEFAVGQDGTWPPGEYTVWLEVDASQLIEESDENNNTSKNLRFLVVPPKAEPVTTERIVFVSERTGSAQIWVMNADGSNQQQLTSEGDNRAPGWSADNRQILFESNRTGVWSPYVMNADGTRQEPLPYAEGCVSPAYSSHGQLSYACFVDQNWELFVDSKRVTYNDTDDRLYSWSPLGNRIAFEARKPGKERDEYRVVWRVDANGDGLLPLTDSAYLSWNVNWAPDANQLVFASNRDKNARVFTILPDGTQWQGLTSPERWSQLPIWSPDGQWLAFVSNDPDQVWSLYSIEIGGERQIRLAKYTHPAQFASWSPDSRSLAFSSNAGGDFEIWITSYDGQASQQLTDNNSDDHSPQWSHRVPE